MRKILMLIKVDFHRVEFCAIAENALKRFFGACSLNKNLPLYERFSELCRIAGAQAQSRIQFSFARELFAISQSNGLMNVRLRNANLARV